MKSLDGKYWRDALTLDELLEYRKRLKEEPLQETERRISEEWEEMEVSGDDSLLSGNDLMRLKRQIDSSIRKKSFFMKTSWILFIAASFLIILFLGTTVSLTKEKRSIEASEVSLFTSSGESSHVRLPDGTSVSLNEDSRLAYKYAAFNGRNRVISFSGEGYFEVARDETKPFIINVGEMKVEVLGTKFLLVMRDSLRQGELVLDEGKVRLQSNIADCTVTMVEGQKAILDFSSGMLSVVKAEKMGKSSFDHSRIEFFDTPLREIITAVASQYNVEIRVKGKCPDAHFTGSLPASDLSEALEILSKVYDLDIALSGGTFIVSSRR